MITPQTEITKKDRRGKPRMFENVMRIYSIRIDEGTYQMAMMIGEGNLSKGIRELVKIGYEQSKKGLSE